MLRYEMPVVYFVLKKLCSAQSVFEPDWHVIESVARASKDASYRKPKFRRYLEEYSRNGLFCRRGKVLTPRRKTYYEGICRRKIEYFITEQETAAQGSQELAQRRTVAAKYKKYDQNNLINL